MKRLYSQWSYRVLNLPILSKGESYTTSNPVERTVSRRKTSARTPKLEVNIFLKCRASYLLKLIMHSFQVFCGCLCFVSNPPMFARLRKLPLYLRCFLVLSVLLTSLIPWLIPYMWCQVAASLEMLYKLGTHLARLPQVRKHGCEVAGLPLGDYILCGVATW